MLRVSNKLVALNLLRSIIRITNRPSLFHLAEPVLERSFHFMGFFILHPSNIFDQVFKRRALTSIFVRDCVLVDLYGGNQCHGIHWELGNYQIFL